MDTRNLLLYRFEDMIFCDVVNLGVTLLRCDGVVTEILCPENVHSSKSVYCLGKVAYFMKRKVNEFV